MLPSDKQPPASPAVHLPGDVEVAQVITVQDGGVVHEIVGRQNVYQITRPRPVDAAMVAAAQALLASMPTGDVEPPPEIATLPYGSHIKGFRPNSLFVGRRAELRALARALATRPAGQPIAISTGIGGVGKTQLAIEFAHRYGQYFAGGVFWVTMEQAGDIPIEVAVCGAGGLVDWRPDYAELKPAEQLALVLAAWRSPLPRLLIFDNCEDEGLLAQWCPPSGGCRVLVTSRRTTWDPTLGVSTLPLDVLPREASAALLRKFRPKLNDADADAIADELGDLPLALHLAGSHLRAYRTITPATLLAELRSLELLKHPALQGRGSSLRPTGRELHVARVFALSYERLDAAAPTDALAMSLLARAAYFAPGLPLRRDMLKWTVSSEAQDAALLVEDALRRLADLGLLEELALGDAGDRQADATPSSDDEADDAVETVRLHRLLSAFARQVSDDASAQPVVEEALLNVARQLDASTYLAASELVLPHLRYVADQALLRVDERAALLCNSIGVYLKGMANYPVAQPYLVRALAINREVLGEKHPDTARSLNNLGALLDSMGELASARPYLEQALAINREVLGEKHPDTAQSLNNLGALLDSMGELASARPYYEQALAIRREVLGEQHPDIAQSLNNLGVLLQAQGELASARPYYEQALTIYREVLGEQHTHIALSLNNLGALLQAQGELASARPYYEQALTIYREVLGEKHPDTARSLNNLGVLHAYAGRFSEALPLVERALAIRESVLGVQHPDTIVTRETLANIQAAMGATS